MFSIERERELFEFGSIMAQAYHNPKTLRKLDPSRHDLLDTAELPDFVKIPGRGM